MITRRTFSQFVALIVGAPAIVKAAEPTLSIAKPTELGLKYTSQEFYFEVPVRDKKQIIAYDAFRLNVRIIPYLDSERPVFNQRLLHRASLIVNLSTGKVYKDRMYDGSVPALVGYGARGAPLVDDEWLQSKGYALFVRMSNVV